MSACSDGNGGNFRTLLFIWFLPRVRTCHELYFIFFFFLSISVCFGGQWQQFIYITLLSVVAYNLASNASMARGSLLLASCSLLLGGGPQQTDTHNRQNKRESLKFFRRTKQWICPWSPLLYPLFTFPLVQSAFGFFWFFFSTKLYSNARTLCDLSVFVLISTLFSIAVYFMYTPKEGAWLRIKLDVQDLQY